MKWELVGVTGISLILLIGGVLGTVSGLGNSVAAWNVLILVGFLGLGIAQVLRNLSRRLAQLEKKSEVAAKEKAGPV